MPEKKPAQAKVARLYKQAEKTMLKKTEELNERVKELNCLFEISQLMDKPNILIGDIVQGIVDCIPPAWQYPEITCAKAVLNDQIYTTKNFRETSWKQTRNIAVNGNNIGAIEVFYLQKKPERYEGPFLKEEKRLLKSIAERMGKIIKHMQVVEALRESEEKYRLLVENANEGILVAQDEMLKFVNPKLTEISGYSEQELTSKPFVDFVHPDDREMVMERHVRKLGGNEKPGRYMFRFLDKDGNIRWVENNSVIITWKGKPATLNFLNDITKRKQNEEEIKKAERLLSSTFNALQDLVIVIDKDLRVVTSNWKDHRHITEIECQGNPYCYAVTMRRNTPCEHCPAMAVFETGEIKTFEHNNPVDGQIREIQIAPIFDDLQNVVMVVEHFRNITERKRTEEALRESEARFKSIFENSPIGFYRTTPDGRILDANPALIRMLGYVSFKDLSAVNLETHDYHPEYPRRQFRERIECDGEIKGMESFWKRSDGKLMFLRENARAIRDADGKIVCYEGTIEDISDQKQAEEQIRNLSQQLIKAHEDERQMISRELHDRVAQDLSILKIGLDTLFDNQASLSSEIQKKVPEFSGLLQRIIGTVRDLSYELRLPGLDNMGLIPALSMYCEEFSEQSGVKIEFQAAGMSTFNLNFDTEMNLYRLIQEGLNNIRKHAAAAQASVKLIGSYPHIILRIEDGGKGFDVQERARATGKDRRMGLRSMQERVSLMKGEMTIQSQPMKGTHIFIKFPYQEKKHGSKENHIDR